MTNRTNHLGQPIGFPLEGWTPRPHPPRSPMEGRFCRVEPLDLDRHVGDLHAANLQDAAGANWTYLAYGPFERLDDYRAWIVTTCLNEDPMFYAVVDRTTGRAVGVASYLRIEPQMGVIEVGHINYSPLLQKTAASTEAMYLMMRRVFDELGYRRYEWKCDALNAPSRATAQRLGFSFEGIFRQAAVYKNRNRDTAWFSIIDSEWPRLKHAHESWLGPENFDSNGRQRRSLASFMLALP